MARRSTETEKRMFGVLLGFALFFIVMKIRGEPINLTEANQLFQVFGLGMFGYLFGGLLK